MRWNSPGNSNGGSIHGHNAHVLVLCKRRGQALVVVWVQLVGDERIACPYQARNKGGRPRIGAQLGRRTIRARDLGKVGCEHGERACVARAAVGRFPQTCDALAPLAGCRRLARVEAIAASAGMRVDDTERGRLLFQVFEAQHEHGVLEHIREIAGMKGVAVVHGEGTISTSPGFTADKATKRPGTRGRRDTRLLDTGDKTRIAEGIDDRF
jgi:hypothetical protein